MCLRDCLPIAAALSKGYTVRGQSEESGRSAARTLPHEPDDPTLKRAVGCTATGSTVVRTLGKSNDTYLFQVGEHVWRELPNEILPHGEAPQGSQADERQIRQVGDLVRGESQILQQFLRNQPRVGKKAYPGRGGKFHCTVWRETETEFALHLPVAGKVCAPQFSVELDGGVDRLDPVARQHQALDVGVERDGDDVEVGCGRARGRPRGVVARARVRAETVGGGQEAGDDCRRRRLPERAHASPRALAAVSHLLPAEFMEHSMDRNLALFRSGYF